MAEETQLKTLRRKRGDLKHRLTCFNKFTSTFKVNVEKPEDNVSDTNFIELQDRISRFSTFLDEFDQVQAAIDGLDSDENVESYLETREHIEDTYFATMALAKNILRKHELKNELVVDEQASVVNQSILSEQSHRGPQQLLSPSFSTNVKLPTITLPKFAGEYENWLEFRDTFISMIHSKPHISSIEKFHYLRASLEGCASQAIKNIDISASNYAIAWNIINDRYNNKRLMVNNHVKALFDLSPIKEESFSDLRKLLDTVSKHLRSLDSLEQHTENWDTLVIHMIVSKLDSTTAREWEETINQQELPTLGSLKNFIKDRADLLETLYLREKKGLANISNKRERRQCHTCSQVSSQSLPKNLNKNSCPLCKESHYLYQCANFLKLPIKSRIDEVKRLRLCLNCLRDSHFSRDCRSKSCKECQQRHNTLLHFHKEKSPDTPQGFTSVNIGQAHSNVLLSTALVDVIDLKGVSHKARALLDSGSQSNFISENFCRNLKIPTVKIESSVVGIGEVLSNIKFSCRLKIASRSCGFSADIHCLGINKITENTPNFHFDKARFFIPSNLKLADPNFDKPSSIDILLGAGIFWDLLCVGQVRLGPELPLAQKTKLGWIITGPLQQPNNSHVQCNLSSNLEIQNQLARFWEIEEATNTKSLSIEERACEAHFASTHQRVKGRFMVAIPVKESLDKLGESRECALKRFYALEHRLQRNPVLRELYVNFMKEYELLNHMKQIDCDHEEIKPVYYLPHHGILKEQSATTKLRVVFDGSAPSDTGVSLNDIQMVGPTIQDDLISILLRFRFHNYVVTADIAKMYRQVLLAPEYTKLHRILWRADPKSEILTYELNTVTYGTASASFLAIRCLKQLALEYASANPIVSQVISHDFYVDDLLTGAATIADTVKLAEEIAAVLKSGGFDLRKWSSNDTKILTGIHKSTAESMILGNNENTRTLGILWLPALDALSYKISNESTPSTISKRVILSDISQIFDPLGLLSPCIITGKILLQRLWLLKLSWDESVPMSVYSEWLEFRSKLILLNDVHINRQVTCRNRIRVELHGFCDSSQEAYGACIYIRSVDEDRHIQCNLLCAKSKVAPLKSISIPRLELCGAFLLSHLYEKVKYSVALTFDSVHFWTDSKIVLGWLNTSPHLLQTFVANRVAEIQRITDAGSWFHVPSAQNPADLASRGIHPRTLTTSSIWWHGPKWLHQSEDNWPRSQSEVYNINLPEFKRSRTQVHTSCVTLDFIPFHRFSSFVRLKRTISWCLRFIHNCRKTKPEREYGYLTAVELETSFFVLVKVAQRQSFSQEWQILNEGKNTISKGKLSGLAPFIDDRGIIRVGGRLQQSDFSFDKRHPILLCSKHDLTKLIFQFEHVRLLHGGPQLLLSSIRDTIWPIAGRNLARKTVRNCVTCARYSATPLQAIMGNLPASRIRSMPPFYNTGVDYAGPYRIKDRKGRGYKVYKSYVCLFVCCSTKALHLELVTDLTSESFIATLRRFISRRGKPAHIYSDNGTNFVGANSELNELASFLSKGKDEIGNALANEKICWHFIPPHAPNFGGLWEAGVKSTKHHLKRILKNSLLTFEDFYTVLTQIECVLNSRPLTPLSSDPNDLEVLTPAHFLIGRPLTSASDPNVLNIKENRLSHFQHLQRLSQHFWFRWSKEYVSELQQRQKWKQTQHNIQLNSMVLIKEDHVPPSKWHYGRVIQLHPGLDNVVRVVSIKTANGVVKRGLCKVCPLPVDV